jgi:dolichol-phosphate mannosyltransferase
MRAVAVVPTYNERENLPILIRRLQEASPGLHVLVVDDNSPDGTGLIADDLASVHQGSVFVLHRTVKAGLGVAYVAGFRWALDHDYDVILQMDADLSHDPSYVPRFLEKIEHSDVVIGSRYANGINVVGWDFKRLLLSKLASYYVRIITGMPVTDATGGFKCWRRRTLAEVDLATVFSNGYLFQIETTFKAFRRGCKIEEQTIIFYERSYGRSKLDWHIIVEAVWGVVRLRIASYMERPRPRKSDRPLASREVSAQ